MVVCYYTVISFYYVIWYVDYGNIYVSCDTFRNRSKNLIFNCKAVPWQWV